MERCKKKRLYKMNNPKIKTARSQIIIAFIVNIINLIFYYSVLLKLDCFIIDKLFDILFYNKSKALIFIFIFLLILSSRIVLWDNLIEDKKIIYLFSVINILCNILNLITIFIKFGKELEEQWHFG